MCALSDVKRYCKLVAHDAEKGQHGDYRTDENIAYLSARDGILSGIEE
jgi:hypothetical protein